MSLQVFPHPATALSHARSPCLRRGTTQRNEGRDRNLVAKTGGSPLSGSRCRRQQLGRLRDTWGQKCHNEKHK